MLHFQNVFPCKNKQEVSSNKQKYETANGAPPNDDEPKHSKMGKTSTS